MPETITAEGAAAIPHDPERTAISQMYALGGTIADRVLPPLPPLGSRKFEYQKWGKADAFQVPDNRMGRISQPNRVEFTGEKVVDETEHYGLFDDVPVEDVDAAASSRMRTPEQADPLDNATIMITHLMRLAREVRVANVVFAASSYDPDMRGVLAANQRFNVNASTPIKHILDALDKPLVRPNVAVIGSDAWLALRQHPDIVKAIHRNEGERGITSTQAVADLFDLEELIVGRSRIASNVEGQDLALKRVWGKSMALIFRGGPTGGPPGAEGSGLAPNVKIPTYGFTANYVQGDVRTMFKPEIGVKGAHRVAVIESCKEVVCGGDGFGYLMTTVVD